ncbi:MAG TPA: hypothetical protein VGX02_08105 [Candidatus Eremiobacteraceae bacterium]|jgi:hypothetical protein|nr:hypothetical protein [Candidatus Eremiobacteraceae bacterium]
MDRKEFVVAGALAAAASSVQWLRDGGVLRAAFDRDAVAVITAAPDVFGAIVRAVLPSDDPRFSAVTPETIERRADNIFSIAQDTGVQSNLVLFDDLLLFAAPPPALIAAENDQFPVSALDKDAIAPLSVRVTRDAGAYQALAVRWPAGSAHFTQLGLAEQRAYMMLWARSALAVRRRFYRSMKTLVMVATYSLDASWPAIRYAGPLLHPRPQ